MNCIKNIISKVGGEEIFEEIIKNYSDYSDFKLKDYKYKYIIRYGLNLFRNRIIVNISADNYPDEKNGEIYFMKLILSIDDFFIYYRDYKLNELI